MGASASWLSRPVSLPTSCREVPQEEHSHMGGWAERGSFWLYDIDLGGIKVGKVWGEKIFGFGDPQDLGPALHSVPTLPEIRVLIMWLKTRASGAVVHTGPKASEKVTST